jgi:hypothetical protein
MIKTCPGTVAAAFAKADVPSLPHLSANRPAPDLRRAGRSTTSQDKLFRMSVHA